MVEAAAHAGFTSAGVRISGRRVRDPLDSVIGNRRAISDLRKAASDRGVRLSNVTAWHLYPDVHFDDLRRVVDTTAELGVPLITVNVYLDDAGLLTATLARYCEEAALAGVQIGLEFVPFSSVKSLRDARAVFASVGAPNLRYIIDPLHLARSGGQPDEVHELGNSIAVLQLCDAKVLSHPASDEDLRDEARNRRLFPGDGELPLRALLSHVPQDVEIEYEVPRQDLAALTPVERARVAHAVLDSFLSRNGQFHAGISGDPTQKWRIS